jgi:hypothetical protein
METDVVTIAPGNPLDNISVYFQGGQFGGGGPIGLALYAVVGGFRTRVAQAQQQGTLNGVLVEFQSIGAGSSESEEVDAGGTSYVITAIDLSTIVPSPAVPARQPVTVTLAGVNTFDTAPDANFGGVIPLPVGGSGSLPVFAGYAQFMDVAIDQTNLPGATVTVTADCGPNTVQAIVKQATLSGRDQTIASVFRGLVLPAAMRYFVSVANASTLNFSTTLTAITYSVMATAGGVVILNGDVIGPSSANTVIKWSNVPLNRVGVNSFAAPTDAAIPIFNAGLGEWFAITPTGDVTLTDAGATKVVAWENVPLDPASMGAPLVGDIPVFTAGHWVATPPGSIPFVVTLIGNVNGPSNANLWASLTLDANNVNVVIPTSQGWYYVGVRNLSATRQVLLPAAPADGEVVVVTDEDGSLGAQTFNVVGNGKNIISAEGTLATFPMNTMYPGSHGSTAFQYDVAAGAWFVWADYAPNAAEVVTLNGNANGPSNNNTVQYFPTSTTDADITVAAQPHPHGLIYEGFNGLTATRNGFLNPAPTPGDVVVWKDEDGSLGKPQNFVINGSGKNIDGVPTFTMMASNVGPFGSITVLYTGTAWAII